jgi:hypothetical protein
MSKVFGLFLILGALSVSACSEYLDRRDTLLLGAGEAVQTNLVTHMVDPWPRVAQHRDMPFSGERGARAVRRYHCGPGAAPSAGGGGSFGSSNVTIIQGNAAPTPPPGPC